MYRHRRCAGFLFAAFLLVVFPHDWHLILADNFAEIGEQYAADHGRGRGSLEAIAEANPAAFNDAPWFE
jgi:hypothetical protein